MNIKDIKADNIAKLKSAIDERIQTIIESGRLESLKETIDNFCEDPYHKDNDFYFDETGSLNASIEVCLRELAGEEPEVISEIMDSLCDFGFCYQDQYARGPLDWRVDQCLGTPTIFNESPYKRCLAIHSPELSLEIKSVIDSDHGFALIERAMRKTGVFENIVSTDYHGNFCEFLSVPKNIINLSDKKLQEFITLKELQNEND